LLNEHHVRFAERERLPHKPSQTLPERVVEPFNVVGLVNVVGLAAAFVTGNVLALRHYLLVGFPTGAKKGALF